jgi:serine-type D-Ala-D-Ala carboxypeptidase (penicillin-binding protein 5/6)
MSPYSILQEGQLRRKRTYGRARRGYARHHYGWFVLLTALLCLVALLALMAGRASGPTVSHAGRLASRRPAVTPVVRSDYGIVLAPHQLRLNPNLPLSSGLLFDVNTGRVLWERDPEAILPIASLTKMMTALVVVAHSSPAARALITTQAVHFSGSGVGVLPQGKQVLVRTLLYGLLLPSGNDAAIALAQHVAGTRARFIAMMNARARQMGLHCTHYATVSGIIDQDNHSCASDLALIAHTLLVQPLLARIVASASAVEPLPVKGGKVWLYNNNPLYQLNYPGTDGVKTGYTTAAGQCLVAAARRGKRWLGVVLLHSGNTGSQAEQLLNAGFAANSE